jgi:Zn finger protein HypA/HybF involved in hydrogenase expression
MRRSIVVEDVPLRVYCPRCRAERDPVSIQYLQCAVCGDPAPDVIHGAELEMVSLELQA